jgi:hypothetical protein
MDFQKESLELLKAFVRTAFKYQVATGLEANITDLKKLRNQYYTEGLTSEVTELDFVINFLVKERDVKIELHKRTLDKVKELFYKVPVGTMVSFRYKTETLTGEFRGFVGDRALVICKYQDSFRLFEVSPFDLKL